MDDGVLDLSLALPKELGGKGGATNPEQLFAAGYFACFENAVIHVTRKGFAVVAQEVRELAQRSAKAAKEIKTLITASGAQVANGVALVTNAGSALHEIADQVHEINTNVTAIVEAAREQSTALGEINRAINTVDQGTQQNAAMVEEQTAASHGLAREAAALFELLDQFRFADKAVVRKVTAPVATSRPVAAKPVWQPTAIVRGSAAIAVQADWEEF